MNIATSIVEIIGSEKKELRGSWVKWLCALNGALAFQQYVGQFLEKQKFPTPAGKRKVAYVSQTQNDSLNVV